MGNFIEMQDEKIGTVPNKRYMAIVLRFLKETKLLSYWKVYVTTQDFLSYSKCKNRHWSDRKNVLDIFGCCGFTTFLSKEYSKKLKVYYLPNYDYTVNIYHVFSVFVRKFYPKEFEECKGMRGYELAERVSNCGIIKFVEKKIIIQWS